MGNKKAMLKQLDKKDLIKLAREKNIKIPEKWKKSQMVEFLEPNLTQKDINEYLKKITGSKTGRGLGAKHAGVTYENKIRDWLSNQGYKCRNVKGKGYEIDIVGKREVGSFLSKHMEYVVVECKDKPKVVPRDLKKFVGNFMIFKNKHKEDDVKGLFVYSGVADSDVKSIARNYGDITLKKIGR